MHRFNVNPNLVRECKCRMFATAKRDFRDTIGLAGDYYTDPVNYIEGPGASNAFHIVRVIDNRANLLSAEKVLEEATDDEYAFVRDAYLQRRQNLVYDGNPPEEDFDVFSD